MRKSMHLEMLVLAACAASPSRVPRWGGQIQRGDALELTASAAIAVGVRTFALDARYIPSPSMEPAFAIGDHLLLEKVSRFFRPLARGDVVCFQPPPALEAAAPDGSCFIKRVVGVEGDEVRVAGGRLLVNGEAQAEPYLPEPMRYAMTTLVVPPGHIFVLGDNRNHSYDSHCWGCLRRERVLGRPLCTYWPPRRVRGRGAYKAVAGAATCVEAGVDGARWLWRSGGAQLERNLEPLRTRVRRVEISSTTYTPIG